MKKAALYARVSTARQEQEETIDSQIAEVKQRIEADGNIIEQANIYVDEGYSGSMLERPALDAMLDAAKAKGFDVLYIYDLGRLSRQLSHLLIVIEDLEKQNREIISLHERITGTPEDKFLLQIMGSMHEYERMKIAERFRRGKMFKAKSGKIIGYEAPYGYCYNRETDTLDIYEPEAAVVRKIYDWVGREGISTYAVVQRLHEEGIMPRKQKQEYWTRGPVRRILTNETYIGKHHYNKSESIVPRYYLKDDVKYRKIQKTGRKVRPREEWIAFDVPAIITAELFHEVQEQIKRNVIFNPKNRRCNYLLTGLIKCACGANRNGDGPDGKKYYRCISRTKSFDHINRCKVGGLNVTVIDSLVWQQIAQLLSDPKQIREHAQRWLDGQKSSRTAIDTVAIESRLRELENEQRRYVDAYGKGLLPEPLFAEKMHSTQKQIEIVKKERANASENMVVTGKIDLEQLVEKAARKIGELAFEQKKYIIERVVDKIVATPQEVTIWGHIPVPALASTGKVKHEPFTRHRRPP